MAEHPDEAVEPVPGFPVQQQENTFIRVSPPPITTTNSTTSTGSNQTVRGVPTPGLTTVKTPSYPFPPMPADSSSPIGTPGFHRPFTVLSPTIQPSPIQSAKGRISREFMASRNPAIEQSAPIMTPSAYDIMLRIQSEPGLASYWTNLTQILKESFGADRASLAIPSDSTDVENVPWAQLATYSMAEEDHMSQATHEAQSSMGSVYEKIQESTESDQVRGKQTSSTNLKNMAHASRPRLESRHSYAGYPQKTQQQTSFELGMSSLPRRPTPSRRGSHASLRGNAALSAESLHRHDEAEADKGPLSDDTYGSSRSFPGKILSPIRSLETEKNPLLSSAGVVRVMNRNKTVILTRMYAEDDMDSARRRHKGTGSIRVSHREWPTPSKIDHNPQSWLNSQQQTVEPVSAIPKRPRSHTSDSSHSSSTARSMGELYHDYQDVDQVPPSPWFQSPTPSPAALIDAESYFPATVDESTFADEPPTYQYSADRAIPAIGVDQSNSIIHIPLVHPIISQTRKGKSRPRPDRITSTASLTRLYEGSLASQASSDSNRLIPYAILSFSTSTVPYSTDLINMISTLAPLLATSLHLARQHSKLQSEVTSLKDNSSRLWQGLRDQSMSNLAGASGLSFTTGQDRGLSLAGVMGAVGATDHTYSPGHSPRASFGGLSAMTTPIHGVFDSANPNNPPSLRTPNSPSGHLLDSYFYPKLNQDHNDEKRDPHKHRSERYQKPPLSGNSDSSTTTSPSKRSSSSLLTTVEEPSSDSSRPGKLSTTFGDLTKDTLMTMIENGATQQFIAKADTGDLDWVNSKFRAYRQATFAEVKERPWKHIFKEDRKAFRKEFKRILVTGESFSSHLRLIRYDKAVRWFHMRIQPLQIQRGVTIWHGQAMDIHDQHEGEVKAARAKEKMMAEQKHRAIADSIPVIIFAASVPSGMTYANAHWLSYSGQTLEQSLGFGFLEHVHPEDLSKCRFPGFGDVPDDEPAPYLASPKLTLVRQNSSASSTGRSEGTDATETTIKGKADNSSEPSSTGLQGPSPHLTRLIKEGAIKCSRDAQGNIVIMTEMRLKSKTNEYRWHLVQGSYIESVNFGQGDAQWFIACSDISNQKQNEAKLKELNTTLEKEMARKMEYLSSMSHEIRTPLNGILGNLQFLNDSGLLERQQEWTFGIEMAARGMSKLINDILDVSKAEAKMLKLFPEWFSPRSNIENALEILTSRASEKKLELCYEINETVPWQLKGDGGRIKQILLNLVGNAIKFTKRGEILVKCDLLEQSTVEKSPALEGGEIYVRWTVIDTGNGFTEADKQLLFKSYSQIETEDTRNIGGTGLGLILCKTMVELHGGQIEAWSVPGEGATFTFFARFHTSEDKEQTLDSQSSTTSIIQPVEAPGFVSKSSTSSILPLASPITPAPEVALFREVVTESPGTIPRFSRADSQDSPAVLSDSSSIRSTGSLPLHRSLRSSASTLGSTTAFPLKMPLPSQPSAGSEDPENMKGSTPTPAVPTSKSPVGIDAVVATQPLKPRPRLLSVLVVCPLPATRRATVLHVERIIPKAVPRSVTAEENYEDGIKMLTGDNPITFTHVVLQVPIAAHVLPFMEAIIGSRVHPMTCILAITDPVQRAAVMEAAPEFDYDQLAVDERFQFVLKPAKPLNFAKIFDPRNENTKFLDDPIRVQQRETQRLQKEAYALFKKVLGNKGIRVLAVEDNDLQMQILYNFLARVCLLETTKAWNGAECCEEVFSHKPLHYSAIVSDIEMPGMDGYAACRKIRAWEVEHGHPHVPIISLSANVMRHGWRASAANGFTQYCMKPVKFADLGHIIIDLIKPGTPHVFLRDRPVPKEVLEQEAEG